MGILTDLCNKIEEKWENGIEPDLMVMNQQTYDQLMKAVQVGVGYWSKSSNRLPTLQRIPIAIANVDDVVFYKSV